MNGRGEQAYSSNSSTPYRDQCKCGAKRIDKQIGLEASTEEYLEKLVAVFREVRRVLRDDGLIFINMGDSYSSGGRDSYDDSLYSKKGVRNASAGIKRNTATWAKPKDLLGMPWMLALALRSDGWYLRRDIIWNKPNPMPESVEDRPTTSHEYIFMLSKCERYFFDAEAIKEPVTGEAHSRAAAEYPGNAMRDDNRRRGVNPKATREGQNSRMQVDRDPRHVEYNGRTLNRNLDNGLRPRQNESFSAAVVDLVTSRHKRSVWTMATSPFPAELCRNCKAVYMDGVDTQKPCKKCQSKTGSRITRRSRQNSRRPASWPALQRRAVARCAGRHGLESLRKWPPIGRKSFQVAWRHTTGTTAPYISKGENLIPSTVQCLRR